MSEKIELSEDMKSKDMKFEEAMAKLEALSEALSGENLPLDKAIAVYEEGIVCYQRCKEILEDANRRIAVIEEGMEKTR
jgi:exodeoxyribonuclease VII small subunit